MRRWRHLHRQSFGSLPCQSFQLGQTRFDFLPFVVIDPTSKLDCCVDQTSDDEPKSANVPLRTLIDFFNAIEVNASTLRQIAAIMTIKRGDSHNRIQASKARSLSFGRGL